MQQTTSRQSWLDFAKGLGILLVMIGHSSLYTASMLVYIFHMPMFFFLSGYVYSDRGLTGWQFLRKKARRLLLPYYVLGSVILAADVIRLLAERRFTPRYVNWGQVYAWIEGYLTQKRFGTVWYISCLFWLNCVFFLVLKLCRRRLRRAAAVVAVLTLGAILYDALGGGALPGNIDVAFTMLPFFLAGYAARQTEILQRPFWERFRWPLFLGLAALSLAAGLGNYAFMREKLDIFYNKYGIWPLMYLGAFAGTFAVVCLCRNAHGRVLEYIGCHSMLFYAWHQDVINPPVQALLRQFHLFQGWTLFARAGETLVCILATLLVLWGPTEFLRRRKCGAWFGV